MLKYVIAPLLALSLAGCAGSLPPAVGPVITDVNALVPQVQTTAQKICGWVPLASDVATLIGALTGNGAIVVTASSVANSICASVNAAKAKLRGGPPAAVMVRGVRVRHDTPARRSLAPSPSAVTVNGVLVHRQ